MAGERGKEKAITAAVVNIDPAIPPPSARHTKNNADAHFGFIKIIAVFKKFRLLQTKHIPLNDPT